MDAVSCKAVPHCQWRLWRAGQRTKGCYVDEDHPAPGVAGLFPVPRRVVACFGWCAQNTPRGISIPSSGVEHAAPDSEASAIGLQDWCVLCCMTKKYTAPPVPVWPLGGRGAGTQEGVAGHEQLACVCCATTNWRAGVP